MRTQRTPLRRLTAEEKERVDRLYKHMALGLLGEKGVMLARNEYVDQTIWELIHAVKEDAKLLAAWTCWCGARDMDGLRWPASQFQTELEVALASISGVEVQRARALLNGGAR